MFRMSIGQTCPACHGDDAAAPCAYPGESARGCLRDARLLATAQATTASPRKPAPTRRKPAVRKSVGLSEFPSNKDNDLALLEERASIREEKDIILSDTAKSALDEILIEHNRMDILRSYGLQPAQKILFCGPPGCGKTLAAEVISNSLAMPLVVVRLDSIISSLLGETAANLRKVFDYITQHPVVALFDEFDALTKDRGDTADHGELKRSVNAVLQMLDGYRGESILIATTNYESLLDHAVWRRFDEVVRFEMPNLEQIKHLLALKLSGIRRNFEVDDHHIADLFKGLSHADIERVLRRAVKEMVLAGREFLEKTHIETALAREYRRGQ
jgi:AAA+ superfamily predicted ATPase